jgi:hypothetical protein
MRSIFLSCLLFLTPASALWAQNAQDTELTDLLGLQALVFAENAVAGLPGEYAFQIVQPPSLPPFLKPGKITFAAERLSKQEPIGRFFVVFRVSVDGRPSATTRVEMEGAWSGTLYRAKSALQRKAAITENEVEAYAFTGVPPVGAVKELPSDIRLRQPLTM